LETLSPMLSLHGARFFSLQKGLAAEQLATLRANPDIVDLGPELEDFGDTAAVISQLDLVICIDTAVAHLAGALGKPVWVMLPQPADWRWLEEREDSPWYPTMRLFRQIRRGDWSDVVERVKVALQERVRVALASPSSRADSRPRSVVPRSPVVSIPSAAPGHRRGFSAVAEARAGILQYLPDEAIVGDSIGWYGEYLQPQIELLTRLIRPGATVLEAAAGVGVHALSLAAAVGSDGHLFLYESRPVVRRILQQNLAANGVRNVTLIRRDLGGSVATATAAAGTTRGVPTSETLDELQLARLDWLKINEGSAALDILAGAAQTLWGLRPLLFISAADQALLAELAKHAQGFSYRCWRMETALFHPSNFNRRDKDIFAGRKALTLLAIPEEIEVDIVLDGCIEIQ
jgi:hypothetical protein